MDLDVFKLFAKRVAKETAKLVLFVVVLVSAGLLNEHLYPDWDKAYIVGVFSLVVLALIGIVLKYTWDIAKLDVEYERRWSKK